MQKSVIAILLLVIFASCSEKRSDKNLQITGNIEGLKKGTLYIKKMKDTTLVAIDTIKINGDSHFATELNIDSPEMLYLFLDRGVTNSKDNNLAFFAEKGKMNIESSLEFFNADAKITGSKNQEFYEEYKKVVSRYVDQSLDLIKEQYEAANAKDNAKLQKIKEEQDHLLKMK